MPTPLRAPLCRGNGYAVPLLALLRIAVPALNARA
jgi:hypothetical protein